MSHGLLPTHRLGRLPTDAVRDLAERGDVRFATLDDLEGRVEMIIFAKTLEANDGLIDTDAVLLVRGRVDRKDRNEIKLVVQDAEEFRPSEADVADAQEQLRKEAEPDSTVTVETAEGEVEATVVDLPFVERFSI